MSGSEALRTVAPLRTLENATTRRSPIPSAHRATQGATDDATAPPRRSIRALAERVLAEAEERETRNDPRNDDATAPLPESLRVVQSPAVPRNESAALAAAPGWLWVLLDSKRFGCHVLLVRDDAAIVPPDLAGLVRFTWREVEQLLEKPDFLEPALRVKRSLPGATLLEVGLASADQPRPRPRWFQP